MTTESRDKAYSVRRRWGWRKATFAALMRFAQPVFVWCHVGSRDLKHGFAGPPPGVRLGEATAEELAAAAAELPEQLSPEFLAEAAAAGDYCFAAFVPRDPARPQDGELMAAFVWRSWRPTRHTTLPDGSGIWVTFEPPYRYGYKSYTRPEYRGQQLMRIEAGDPVCIARGARQAIEFIEITNYASLQWSVRAGNTRVGYAGYLRLGRKVWTLRTPGAARHTFAFRHVPAGQTPDDRERG